MELALAERIKAFGVEWDLCSTLPPGRPPTWVGSEVFEAFATHLVLNGLRHLEVDRSDVLALMTGGADDAKLDSIALFVDRTLVLSESDLIAALDTITETTDIEFVFVQATLMDYLGQGKVEKSCTGISNFASLEPALAENDQVRHWRRMKEMLLFALEQRGIERKPSCSLYIVWPSSRALLRPDHHGIMELRRKDVERLDVFHKVDYRLIDGPDLLELADRDERRNLVQLAFSDLTPFEGPPVTGALPPVKSWSGRLVADDLIEAVAGPDGELRPELFADNVRFDLGEAPGSVNEEIGRTLDSPARGRFHLANNGLTLVARDVRQIGPLQLECRDLKIINGAQTTYSLVRHRGSLDPSVKVMAKVVATEDRELVDWIIVGSNRQTTVEAFEFFSRLPFVRRLQQHFDTIVDLKGERILWLERQKGVMTEWQREHGQRVIGIEDMMRAFISVVLERPDLPQVGDWKTLRALVPERIFHPGHDVAAYEIAALILWRAREQMRVAGHGDHYPAKNHLMLAMRLLADPVGLRPDPHVKPGRDRRAQAYLRLMREVLLSPQRSMEIAGAAHAILVQVAASQGRGFNAKSFGTVDATRRVVDMAQRRSAAE